MMVVGRGNGAGIWGGGQHRAPGEAPLSEFPNDPPQRSELYNGGSSIMATGALRSTAPQPLLPSIADVLRGAAAGLPSLLGSAMAAGIFAPQPKPPMLPPTIAPFASVSPAASSPQPDFTTASNSSPAHPLLPQRAASSTTGSSAQDSGSRGSAAVAAPLASARPLQALAFEEFLREKHLAGVVVIAERMPGSLIDDGGQRPISLSGWTVLDVDQWWEDVRVWTGEPTELNERAFFMMLRRLGFKPRNRAPPPATSGLDYGLRRKGVTHSYIFDNALFLRYRQRSRANRPSASGGSETPP